MPICMCKEGIDYFVEGMDHFGEDRDYSFWGLCLSWIVEKKVWTNSLRVWTYLVRLICEMHNNMGFWRGEERMNLE